MKTVAEYTKHASDCRALAKNMPHGCGTLDPGTRCAALIWRPQWQRLVAAFLRPLGSETKPGGSL
jgi:hypothetical protein